MWGLGSGYLCPYATEHTFQLALRMWAPQDTASQRLYQNVMATVSLMIHRTMPVCLSASESLGKSVCVLAWQPLSSLSSPMSMWPLPTTSLTISHKTLKIWHFCLSPVHLPPSRYIQTLKKIGILCPYAIGRVMHKTEFERCVMQRNTMSSYIPRCSWSNKGNNW